MHIYVNVMIAICDRYDHYSNKNHYQNPLTSQIFILSYILSYNYNYNLCKDSL